MQFNSFEFLYFFIIVYTLYLILEHRWQNRLLLVSSYFFYGSWDWRFLFLILLSTVIDFICGKKIEVASDQKRRKIFLTLSITANLGILCTFKYLGFFLNSLISLGNTLGLQLDPFTLSIILPAGISFYTFQTMSYTIDIYLKRLKPCTSFEDFALYVAFFPQLVAGPIERASALLPQILLPRTLNATQMKEGFYLIFWGLYKKVFIADNLAIIVNQSFANYASLSTAETWLATYAFAFQLYCDFSGYSHIARGLSKLLGIELMVNFNTPFFATNLLDFWKRWHISLTTWLRDYVFTPFYFRYKQLYLSTFVVFVLNGIWHGAAWTFVLMGLYWGTTVGIATLREMRKRKANTVKNKSFSHIAVAILLTFHLNCIGFVFFRSGTLDQLMVMLQRLFSWSGTSTPLLLQHATMFVFFTALLTIKEAIIWKKDDLMLIPKSSSLIQFIFYVTLLYQMFVTSLFQVSYAKTSEPFIYFQF